MNQINALAQSVYPKMVEVRRALHQNPEPSMQEFETTRRLAAEMDRLGIPYRLTQPTGLIAQIEGAAPGPRGGPARRHRRPEHRREDRASLCLAGAGHDACLRA